MKTALNVAGVTLVIAEYCMLMADKPVIAGLAGLMAVAFFIPTWFDERHEAVRDTRKQTSHGISFPAGGLLVARTTARKPSVTPRRPALRPVRTPARAA